MLRKFFYAFLLISTFFSELVVLAQSAKPSSLKTATNSSGTCGCDYLPLCAYTAKITIAGKIYYGIDESEKNSVYFNCENGVITRRWTEEEEVYRERLWQWRNDINDYGWVEYYDTEQVSYNRVVLKYNAPVGSTWTNPGSDVVFMIAEKGIMHSYNGTNYKDVIRVRTTVSKPVAYSDFLQKSYDLAKTVYMQGKEISKAEDIYYAKGVGYLHIENAFETLRKEAEKMLTTAERAAREKMDQNLMRKSILNSWVGKWEGKHNDDNRKMTYPAYLTIYKNGMVVYNINNAREKLGSWVHVPDSRNIIITLGEKKLQIGSNSNPQSNIVWDERSFVFKSAVNEGEENYLVERIKEREKIIGVAKKRYDSNFLLLKGVIDPELTGTYRTYHKAGNYVDTAIFKFTNDGHFLAYSPDLRYATGYVYRKEGNDFYRLQSYESLVKENDILDGIWSNERNFNMEVLKFSIVKETDQGTGRLKIVLTYTQKLKNPDRDWVQKTEYYKID